MSDDLPVGLSILMAVYNEVERIEPALDATLAVELPCPFEVIVVDDGSTDGTAEYLRGRELPENARLHFHERNQGKGAAIRTALADARMRWSAIFDADLEYNPDDLRLLLEPLMRDQDINAVFGVRAFDGYHSHSFWFVVGNKLVTLVVNALFNVYLHDLMSCHKGMRTEVFRSLPLREKGFGIEPEITARLLQRGERIFEVPVQYSARASEEGKKLTAVDGLRVVRTLVRCRVSRG
jgi:glycosyltransferase involved in cell wall biosynthesis